MSRNYIILIVIAFGLAIGILFMDKTGKSSETDPATMAISWNDPSRFLTVDEVTKRLIMKDPGIVLIDVRPEVQFKAFAIPGAINIPIDSLLTSTAQQILKMPNIDKVLYSNSSVWSDQAWLLCKRQKIGSLFILDGGINSWFNKIVNLKEPLPSSPQEEIDNYSFRLGANQYFYGTDELLAKPENKEATRQVPVIRNQPQSASGGGC